MIDIATAGGTPLGWLLSTKVYLKTTRGWRLAAHRASRGLPGARPLHGADAPSTLH